MEKIILNLYKKVWQTRGSRFNAHARLEQHANLSNLTISILTVYIIGLNLFPLISFLKSKFTVEDTGYITIILSVLILSISQYISSQEYRLKASRFHNCGKELSRIYEELSRYKENPTNVLIDDIKEISDRYNDILDKYEENHSSLDFEMFKRDNMSEFNNIKNPKWFIIKTYLFSFFKGPFKYYLFIFIPPIALILWMLF